MPKPDRLDLIARAETCVRLASRAQRHYETWRVLTDPSNVARYRPALDRYPDLFILDEHAHLGMCMIQLNALFEVRSDTINVRGLLDAAASVDGDGEVVRKAGDRLREVEPAIRKVFTIRGGAIAHRHAHYTYNDIFKRAQLTPDELSELVNAAESIAWDLAHHFNVKPWNVALYAPIQLEEILDRLTRDLTEGWGVLPLNPTE